jgi:hypothetical protein
MVVSDAEGRVSPSELRAFAARSSARFEAARVSERQSADHEASFRTSSTAASGEASL